MFAHIKKILYLCSRKNETKNILYAKKILFEHTHAGRRA